MNHISSTVNAGQLSRRQFLKVTAGLGLSAAGLALLEACGSKPAAPTTQAETLETTTIRLANYPVICLAPLFMAENLLKSEGFTDVNYVDSGFDFVMQFGGPSLLNIDPATTMLAGVDTGCWELFGNQQVNEIADLKGKTIGIGGLLRVVDQVYISILLGYVGLDPNKDVTWVVQPDFAEQTKQFIDGKIDAFLVWPPFSQELRAKKIGHTVINSMMDKPWSQYSCSMLTAYGGFAQKNPVATKRAVRAVLKAADICANEPERTAKAMVDRGITPNYDYALEAVKMIPYKWREYDPEDTLRFYALRLRDIGLLKGNPDEIIKQAADWHFLNELKAE